MWIGTGEGLNLFDGDQQRIIRFHHKPEDSLSLSHNLVWIIHENRAGTLWLGTSAGLNKLVPGPGSDQPVARFIRYNHQNGLPGEVVDGILEDEQGNLWLSTSRGLSKFNPADETLRNIYANCHLAAQSNQKIGRLSVALPIDGDRNEIEHQKRHETEVC